MQVELRQHVGPVQLVPPHCPHFAAQFPVPAVEVVAAFVVEAVVEAVVAVVLTDVVNVDNPVVEAFEVVVLEEADTLEGEPPPPEHPTRLELMATSSYQKVFTSPP